MDALSGLTDMHFIYVATKLSGEGDDEEAEAASGSGADDGDAPDEPPARS